MDPEMMKMAMEQMKNMTPEQVRQMQQMAANMDPAQMAQAQAMMGSMSPSQIREMQQAAAGFGSGGVGGAPPPLQQPARPAPMADGPLAKAAALKEQGNKLHTAGSYQAASAKYNQARRTLGGDASPAGRALAKACLLNLASCALKLGRNGDAVQHCTDVLAGEPSNVKALYRRGQARLALGEAKEAVLDLAKAVQLSSGDDAAVMREVLENARSQLPPGESAAEGDSTVTIEDITEGETAAAAAAPASAAPPPPQPQSPGLAQAQMAAEMLKNNPAMLSMMESMVGGMSQEQLDAMAAASGQPRITPEQARAQIAAMKAMGPEGLQAAAGMQAAAGAGGPSQEQLARSAEMLRANPALMQQSLAAMRSMSPQQLEEAGRAAGAPPGFFTPERVEQAACMTPEQIREATRTAAAAQAPQPDGASAAPASAPAPAAAAAAVPSAPAAVAPPATAPGGGSMPPGMAQMLSNPEAMAAMSSMMASMSPEDMQRMASVASGMGGGAPGAGGMPEMSPELMAKLATPEMTSMMQRMMNDMPPEQLASVMQQSGMDVTPEQAAAMKAQMGKLSERQMWWLMKAATTVQQMVLAARRAKAYLAARPLLLAAIAVLLLALLLRWLGWA